MEVVSVGVVVGLKRFQEIYETEMWLAWYVECFSYKVYIDLVMVQQISIFEVGMLLILNGRV